MYVVIDRKNQLAITHSIVRDGESSKASAEKELIILNSRFLVDKDNRRDEEQESAGRRGLHCRCAGAGVTSGARRRHHTMRNSVFGHCGPCVS